MTAPQPLDDYATQGPLSDPGPQRAGLDALPRDLAGLCRVVQGLLIHDVSGRDLYGRPPPAFHQASRRTLPLAERLDAILSDDARPLAIARAPFARSVGTCRDYALMLCGLLRRQAVPARVRCGFAAYFHPPGYEDHWVCEYWKAEDGRWALADAQLDDAHRARLAIDFDITDLPRDLFLFPWQAWQDCRAQAADPASFGHGDATGAWFLQVNLARDLLALRKREVSAWDSWRDWPTRDRTLDETALRLCDELAALAERLCRGPASSEAEAAPLLESLSSPPWQV